MGDEGRGYETVEIAGWTLTFPDGRRLALDKPVSWSSHPDLSREERAFAGTAAYEATFEVKGVPARMELDLGRVDSVAVVYVNGAKARTLWCEPFACDIAKLLKPGRNDLRVEVTNTWRNRVVYDLGQPPEKRKTWILYRPHYNPQPTDPYVPAGIPGPVRLRAIRN